MIIKVNRVVDELTQMKKYPEQVYAQGDLSLLNKRKISIVGSRKPTPYTKEMTFSIAQKLSTLGICIVSGAAMGVDAIAHKAAGKNSIAVMANGLDIIYPKVNRELIARLSSEALTLSTYKEGALATKYSFVQRNELVVALGECLIVTQADLESGSMHSINFALNMNKKIYVLAQRIGESKGTNALVQEGKAEVIVDIDAFIATFSNNSSELEEDELLIFCKSNSSYEDVVARFGSKVFEYELDGKIRVENSRVITL